eukprot:gene4920-3532_t
MDTRAKHEKSIYIYIYIYIYTTRGMWIDEERLCSNGLLASHDWMDNGGLIHPPSVGLLSSFSFSMAATQCCRASIVLCLARSRLAPVSLRVARRRLTLGARSSSPLGASPAPVYNNFSTSPVTFTMSGHSLRKSVRRQAFGASGYGDDQLPLENDHTYDPGDPYGHLRIFRRDMVDVGRPLMLSVDVTMKRFLDMFCDFDGKRCKLCNESFHHWHSHCGAIPHMGREGLALELVRAYCGTPDEIVKMFWHRLHNSTLFRRLPSLSHHDSRIRKKRLQYLLRFLNDRRVLVDTFNVMQQMGSSAGRSWEFERLEWVGDNVVKYVFNSHLLCLFPTWEGGMRGRLGYTQFVIDGNEGLARAYDFLELQKLTRSDRVVSKFKSDVVETLFGELQVYLWSTEEDVGFDVHALPFTPDLLPLRAIVGHVMDELAHVMFMYHLEFLLSVVKRVIKDNELQLVKADPALKTDRRMDLAGRSYQAAAAAVPTNIHLTPARVAYKSSGRGGLYQYLESTNYEKFRLATPLGGLLPLPFAASQLAPSPTFMSHLHRDTDLSLRAAAHRMKGLSSSVMQRQPEYDLSGSPCKRPETSYPNSHRDRTRDQVGEGFPLEIEPPYFSQSLRTMVRHTNVVDASFLCHTSEPASSKCAGVCSALLLPETSSSFCICAALVSLILLLVCCVPDISHKPFGRRDRDKKKGQHNQKHTSLKSNVMRTPYQIYKEAVPDGTITAFTSLSREENLPYRIASAEEVLQGHADYLSENPAECSRYAVSAVHTAVGYVSQLAIFLPLMTRSSTAKQLSFNFSLLQRVMELVGMDASLAVHLATQQVSGTVSCSSLGELEAYLSETEQKLRLQAKENGEKIELLRKKPAHASASTASVAAPDSSNASSATADVVPEAPVEAVAAVRVPTAPRKTRRTVAKDEESSEQKIKIETEKGEQQAVTRKTRTAKAPKSGPVDGTTVSTCGRLRTLTPQEKKIVSMLQQMIQLLGHVYATKFNELVPIFDFLISKVDAMEAMVAASTKKSTTQQPAGDAGAMGKKVNTTPLQLELGDIRQAIANANRLFRDDVDCQLELDEDLLHPVSYALLVELNRIEGFLTLPFQEPTPEEKARKAAAREAARQKREEARRKIQERLEKKAAQTAERDKQLARLRYLLGRSVEETDARLSLASSSTADRSHLGYVHYGELPYREMKHYQKAMYIWTMLSSLPKSVQLSKMTFQVFTTGVLHDSEDDNRLMEEIVRQSVEAVQAPAHGGTSPALSRINSHARRWFNILVEYVTKACGKKKSRAPVARPAATSSSDSDGDNDAEEEEEGAEGKGSAAEEDKPDAPAPVKRTFEDELRESLESISQLHSHATWGNISVEDRLNLLQCVVSELLGTEKARDEADTLQREHEEAVAAMEKAMREIHDDAEKGLRNLWKANDADNTGEEADRIFKAVEEKRRALYSTWIRKQDEESTGCIIEPLGADRYRRLYWRFPLDQRIFVQTTPDTLPEIPMPPMPADFRLSAGGTTCRFLDDDEAGAVLGLGTAQQTWGVIAPSYLDAFAATLDTNDAMEGPLRRTLECMAPTLKKNSAPEPTFFRNTRSRQSMHGYVNRFQLFGNKRNGTNLLNWNSVFPCDILELFGRIISSTALHCVFLFARLMSITIPFS